MIDIRVLTKSQTHIYIDGKPRVAKEVVEVVDEEKNLITFKITVQATAKSKDEGMRCALDSWI